MKKVMFRLVLIFMCILLIVFFIYLFSSDELSKKELLYEVAESEKLKILAHSSNVGIIKFGGVIDSLQGIIVSDDKDIEEILKYLSDINVSNISDDGLIPLSADLIISIYAKNDTITPIETVFIYKSGYVKRITDLKVYWIKGNRNIISEIVNLVSGCQGDGSVGCQGDGCQGDGSVDNLPVEVIH